MGSQQPDGWFPSERWVGSASLVGGIGVALLDAGWLGLNALHRATAGSAIAVVVALLAGATAAAIAPRRAAWLAFVVGGGAAALAISMIGLPFVWNDAWGLLGLFGLFIGNLILIVVFGSLGFAYWMASASYLRIRVAAPALVQTGLLVLVGGPVVLAVSVLIPGQPEGVYASNDTSAVIRIGETIDGHWQPVPGVVGVEWVPGVRSQLISPIDSAAKGPGGILDSSGCTTRALVAQRLDGIEVARRERGLCEGETWVITAPGPGE